MQRSIYTRAGLDWFAPFARATTHKHASRRVNGRTVVLRTSPAWEAAISPSRPFAAARCLVCSRTCFTPRRLLRPAPTIQTITSSHRHTGRAGHLRQAIAAYGRCACSVANLCLKSHAHSVTGIVLCFSLWCLPLVVSPFRQSSVVIPAEHVELPSLAGI